MARPKRIGLYSPYDLTPGGGERYLLAMASALQKYGRVELLAPETYSDLRVNQLVRDLGVDLSGRLRVVKVPRTHLRVPYDLFIAMGNEALPPIRGMGNTNLFMCQFPFPLRGAEREARRHLDVQYGRIIVNSEFTCRALLSARERLGVGHSQVTVVYPPCRVPDRPPAERAFDGVIRIVSVGRFFTAGHLKRHDLLITALRRLMSGIRGAPSYELHLVGAANIRWGSRAYLDRLEKRAAGLPVSFHVNATITRLRKVLSGADIYWHAAGWGASARRHRSSSSISESRSLRPWALAVYLSCSTAAGRSKSSTQDGRDTRSGPWVSWSQPRGRTR